MACALLFSACTSISPFSQKAYEQATRLKVESLNLMGKATQPFSKYEEKVEQLSQEIEIAYEFAFGRPDNEISARQWEMLKDPSKNLLGGFLLRWEQESKLSKFFIEEAQKVIGQAFDQIIQLESQKIKPEELR